MGTVNDKLLAEIEEAKKGFRVEAPQVDEREDVDISDVNPIQSVLSGVAALATAYVFWLAVGFAANSFAEHPVDSDMRAIQRARRSCCGGAGPGDAADGDHGRGRGAARARGQVVLDPQCVASEE